MYDPLDTTLFVARGNWGSIFYAQRHDGSVPAKEFYDSCQRPDQAKLNALFQRLAAMGWIPHREKCKVLEGELCELKSHQIRVSFYRAGQCCYLLDGFVKKRDHWTSGELNHAKNLLAEHKAVLTAHTQRRTP